MFAKNILFGLNKAKSKSDASLDIPESTIKEDLIQFAKKEKKIKWKERFVVLTEKKLDFYKEKNKKSVGETINLKNLLIEKSTEKKFSICVTNSEDSFLLNFENDENKFKEWYKIITETSLKSIQKKTVEIKRSNSLTAQAMSIIKKTKVDNPISKSMSPTRLQTVEKKEEVEKIKKKERKLKLTNEQELEIFICAFEIFQKKKQDRTMEEEAYCSALHEYYIKLNKHLFDNDATKPEISLATGTFILCKEERFRTEEEKEFLNEIIEQYNKTKSIHLTNDLNDFEYNKIVRHLIEKKKNTLTKEEKQFLKEIWKLKNELKKLELNNGLKISHSILSHSISQLKYEEELTKDDILFLNELKK
eukprot:gene1020-9925_t